MGPNPIVSKWLRLSTQGHLGQAGLLITDSSEPIQTDLAPLFASGQINPDSFVVLNPLTEQRLRDVSTLRTLTGDVIQGTKQALPILASTPLALPELAGEVTVDSQPSRLDAGRVVARAELAYLLERNCIVASATNEGLGAHYLTAIESQLAEAMRRLELDFEEQVPIEAFQVDFLVSRDHNPGRLIVECDGAGFHDPQRDKERDSHLHRHGFRVLRFSGTRIYRDADSCAQEVRDALLESDVPRPSQPALDSLAPDQKRSALHLDGPARVVAPAGSGKTRVIVARIRNLVEQGVDPSRICAISLTNDAVNEIRERIGDLADEVTLTTLHALAKGVCERGGVEKQLIERVDPGRARSAVTLHSLVHKIVPYEDRNWPGGTKTWADAIKVHRQSFRLPSFQEWDEAAVPSEEAFLAVSSRLERAMQQGGLTDFEGWVHDALRLLARNANFRSLEQGRFDYWIVDEYQDLPLSKLKLLRLLVAPARNLFVVGDDDQVIYGFAGAEPKAFKSFPREFPGTTEYYLGLNYRSKADIVTHSRRLITHNHGRLEKRIDAHRPRGSEYAVSIEETGDYDKRAIDYVRRLLDSGVEAGSIALLFRIGKMAAPVERRLLAAKIPFEPISDSSFYEDRFVGSLGAWLRVCSDTSQGHSSHLGRALDKALFFPNRYLKTEIRQSAARFIAEREPSSPRETARLIEKYARGLEEQQPRHALEAFSNSVASASAEHPRDILDRLNLRPLISREKSKSKGGFAGRSDPVVIYDIFYRLAAQFSATEDLEAWIAERRDDPAVNFQKRANRRAPDRQQVVLSTIHKAKGLEWDHVAVLGPMDGMPDWRAKTLEQQEEERRIAYVAATRARESLLFNCSTRYASEMAEGKPLELPVRSKAKSTAKSPKRPRPVKTDPGRESRMHSLESRLKAIASENARRFRRRTGQ